jgi:2-oxoisovalerate dehydrogenase E1 component alpha subunit
MESDEWPLGDPIKRLKQHLIGLGLWDAERHAAMDLELAEYVKNCAKEAERNGVLGHGLHQPLDTLFEGVFEHMPWHLREQRDQMFAEWEASKK